MAQAKTQADSFLSLTSAYNNQILYFLSLKYNHFLNNLIWITTVSLLIAFLSFLFPASSLDTAVNVLFYLTYLVMTLLLTIISDFPHPCVKSKFRTHPRDPCNWPVPAPLTLLLTTLPLTCYTSSFLGFFQFLRHALLSERVCTHAVFLPGILSPNPTPI